MMIPGYITCSENTLPGCLAKMQNQYGLITKDTDWNDYHTSLSAKARFDELHPRSIGNRYTTDIQQCDETMRWFMNVQLTQEQVDELMSVPTTPVFDFQYAGELDEEGNRKEPPTMKRKNYVDDVWDGTYHDETICVQGVLR